MGMSGEEASGREPGIRPIGGRFADHRFPGADEVGPGNGETGELPAGGGRTVFVQPVQGAFRLAFDRQPNEEVDERPLAPPKAATELEGTLAVVGASLERVPQEERLPEPPHPRQLGKAAVLRNRSLPRRSIESGVDVLQLRSKRGRGPPRRPSAHPGAPCGDARDRTGRAPPRANRRRGASAGGIRSPRRKPSAEAPGRRGTARGSARSAVLPGHAARAAGTRRARG